MTTPDPALMALAELRALCNGVINAADELRVAAAARGNNDKEWWHAGEKHAAEWIKNEIATIFAARKEPPNVR